MHYAETRELGRQSVRLQDLVNPLDDLCDWHLLEQRFVFRRKFLFWKARDVHAWHLHLAVMALVPPWPRPSGTAVVGGVITSPLRTMKNQAPDPSATRPCWVRRIGLS
jgi:hypothetical protein